MSLYKFRARLSDLTDKGQIATCGAIECDELCVQLMASCHQLNKFASRSQFYHKQDN